MALFICQGCGAEHSSWSGQCPNCGTAETIRLAPATDRMVDRIIKGKYKLVRKLGQGGMGAVYLGEQLGIGHRVAIKFLKSEFSNDAEIARRFLNEAKSYARVAHPNAVTFHDFGQDDEGNLFIAMEYCEGVDLKKTLQENGRLPMIEALEVVLQVADVLANAHEKGVIHRDLKPENIMIRRGIRGVHAKVLDFGIARLMDAGPKLTVAGAIAGTPRYMSPEQVEGREVDERADIYSLGIVLYETLTGRQPFDGTSITEILHKQVHEPLPPLTLYAADLDYPEIEAVVRRATAKRANERWPDMLAFASALSQSIPTQAHLSLPPLQRTGVTASISRPLPSPHDAVTQLGVDAEAGAATVVRSDSPVPSPLPLNQPLDLRSEDAAPELVTAPRSKLPFVALAGLLVAGAVGVWLLVRPEPETVSPRPEVVQPKEAPPAVVAPKPEPGTTVDQTEAIKAALREQTAQNFLGQGKTAFEVAKLDEAESYLNSVSADSAASGEAKALLGTIGKIRELLKSAAAFKGQGRCEAALPVYRSVLQLNGKVKDALDGQSACKASTINTTME